jgi:hypothetical protein
MILTTNGADLDGWISAAQTNLLPAFSAAIIMDLAAVHRHDTA